MLANAQVGTIQLESPVMRFRSIEDRKALTVQVAALTSLLVSGFNCLEFKSLIAFDYKINNLYTFGGAEWR